MLQERQEIIQNYERRVKELNDEIAEMRERIQQRKEIEKGYRATELELQNQIKELQYQISLLETQRQEQEKFHLEQIKNNEDKVYSQQQINTMENIFDREKKEL